MTSRFEDIPRRIFLDSSTLQTLQTYGGFLYEWEDLSPNDPIHRDPQGLAKIEALRFIMQVAERAPFEFALSSNSFIEVERRDDSSYLQWAYEVHEHWLSCVALDGAPSCDTNALRAIESKSFNYLGAGDRALIRDALALECQAFLTMENRLPKAAEHVRKTLGLRLMSPVDMWRVLRPWADLFR